MKLASYMHDNAARYGTASLEKASSICRGASVARREPPVWMKPGDVVEVEVDKVGVLRNTIADD